MLPSGTIQLEYDTAAGKQVAFYVAPRSGATAPTRVWVAFSGNASVALDWLYITEQWPNESDAFLLVDYPGYGRSEGRAGIVNTRASADAAVVALAARLPLEMHELEPRLCVLGLSLGCAAGLDFAARHPVQRIALLAPFTSIADVAAQHFSRPASWLLRENYDNRARLRELTARTPPPRIAIFHGTADTLIPVQMGRELAESAPDAIEFFPIEHATHDTIYGDAIAALVDWVNR
jgi:pimeloyl-ACP methyl ester carboxylesterase